MIVNNSPKGGKGGIKMATMFLTAITPPTISQRAIKRWKKAAQEEGSSSAAIKAALAFLAGEAEEPDCWADIVSAQALTWEEQAENLSLVNGWKEEDEQQDLYDLVDRDEIIQLAPNFPGLPWYDPGYGAWIDFLKTI